MTYYVDPPAWLLVVCGVMLALPLSALAGLGAAWLFDRFNRTSDASQERLERVMRSANRTSRAPKL